MNPHRYGTLIFKALGVF